MMAQLRYGIRKKGSFNILYNAIQTILSLVGTETILLLEAHKKLSIFGKLDFMIALMKK